MHLSSRTAQRNARLIPAPLAIPAPRVTLAPAAPPAPRVRTAAARAVAAAAITALAAGCAGASAGSATPPLSRPARALRLAILRSEQVRSLTARMTVTAPGEPAGAFTGSVRMRLKPTITIDETTIAKSPRTRPVRVEEIETSRAIYFENPAFVKETGKPWTKVSTASLSGTTGLAYAAAFLNIEDGNPLDQARLLAAATHVLALGRSRLAGVQVTGYAGAVTPAAALAQLPPGLRSRLAPLLHELAGSPIRFAVWADDHGLIRQIRETMTVGRHVTTTTFDITSVNLPVTIRLPAPRQIADLPG